MENLFHKSHLSSLLCICAWFLVLAVVHAAPQGDISFEEVDENTLEDLAGNKNKGILTADYRIDFDVENITVNF